MRSSISYYVVILLYCLVGLHQADRQSLLPHGESETQKPLNKVDPGAMALLQQLDATYKSMQSFSVELAEEAVSTDGRILVSRRAQLAFRRLDRLTFITGSTAERFFEPSKVISDGHHAFLMLARTPYAYSELPDNSRGSRDHLLYQATIQL